MAKLTGRVLLRNTSGSFATFTTNSELHGGTMILSIAHADVDEATNANVFGAWSDLVVGTRPEGLINCYLTRGENTVQIAAIWESSEHHDRAISEEGSHPAYVVFEASGLDPTHDEYNIVGSLHAH